MHKNCINNRLFNCGNTDVHWYILLILLVLLGNLQLVDTNLILTVITVDFMVLNGSSKCRTIAS